MICSIFSRKIGRPSISVFRLSAISGVHMIVGTVSSQRGFLSEVYFTCEVFLSGPGCYVAGSLFLIVPHIHDVR